MAGSSIWVIHNTSRALWFSRKAAKREFEVRYPHGDAEFLLCPTLVNRRKERRISSTLAELCGSDSSSLEHSECERN